MSPRRWRTADIKQYEESGDSRRDNGNWELEARDGVVNGVDDALYIAPKMEDGSIRYIGDAE